MTLGHHHTIHRHQKHHGWDNAIEPQLFVAPGDIVEFDTVDSFGGQLAPAEAKAADLANLDASLFCPLNGPVYVDGAEPGDALKVTLLSYQTSGTAWTANLKGFGLLPDQFTEPGLLSWIYDPVTLMPAMYGKHARIPLKPFVGTIGVALKEPGRHSVLPPRHVGGNMDLRDLGQGTELYLPIEVPGALFSLGDTHAAQGDGEVCGTAMETPLKVAAQFDLVKQANLKFPRFRTPGPVARHLDLKGFDVTTGIGTDLLQGARDAVAGMVDLLTRQHGMPAVDAYMLCSVCGDLKISDVADRPNMVVSFYFPRIVFE